MEKTTTRYKNTLVPHLLNAAKSLIPRLWRTPEALTMREWVVKVEQTIHTAEDSLEVYDTLWGNWLKFKKSRDYMTIFGA